MNLRSTIMNLIWVWCKWNEI